MLTWMIAALVALGTVGDQALPIQRVALGGTVSLQTQVCGSLPPLTDDTPASLQSGTALVALTADLPEEVQHWHLVMFLMCHEHVPCEDIDQLISADLEQQRPEVRGAVRDIYERGALEGELPPSLAAAGLHQVAVCAGGEPAQFAHCFAAWTPSPTEAPVPGAILATAAPSPTALPPEAPAIATSMLGSSYPTGLAGLPAMWSELDSELMAGAAVLVGVAVVALVAIVVLYSAGAYFRAIDVQGDIRKTGAQARKEMDEVSRQHLGAVTAAITGAPDGQGT